MSNMSESDQKLYIAFEALNFYAYNPPDVIAQDGGKIARDTIEELRGAEPPPMRRVSRPELLHLLRRAREVLEMIPPPLSDCYTNGLQPDINAALPAENEREFIRVARAAGGFPEHDDADLDG